MGYKILLADDSVTVQKIISLTFSDEGVDVVTVNNGEEAIDSLQYMRPSLVMADVSIPGKNGYEICEFIKNHPDLKNTPVVLLVPAFEPFDEKRARSAGADHFLTKPFQSIRALISTIKDLIETTIEADSPANALAPPGGLAKNRDEDKDHVLELDDVLSGAWAAGVASDKHLETAPLISSTDTRYPSLTLPQSVIDEIVDRVVLKIMEKLPAILSHELAISVLPEVVEIVKQQHLSDRVPYHEADSLLELDEV